MKALIRSSPMERKLCTYLEYWSRIERWVSKTFINNSSYSQPEGVPGGILMGASGAGAVHLIAREGANRAYHHPDYQVSER